MRKCNYCGSEFEGNFCPECGEKWQEERLCPNCGAKMNGSVKFCTECGFSLYEKKITTDINTAENIQQVTFDKGKLIEIIYKILGIAPLVLCFLFSVLLFAFYATPVAVMPTEEILGEKIGGLNYGNVYSMYSGILGEFPEFKSAVIALLTLASITLVYSIFCIIAKLTPAIKYKQIKSTNLADVFIVAFNIFYLIFFIIGCVICGIAAYLDDGMGILAAGACPILIIVFSSVFVVLEIGAIIARKYIVKVKPELIENEREKAKIYWKNRMEIVSKLPAPTKPVKPATVERPLKEEDKLIGYKRSLLFACFYSLFGGIIFEYLFFFSISVPNVSIILIVFVFIVPYSILLLAIPFYKTCKNAKNVSEKKLCSKGFFAFPIIICIIFLMLTPFVIFISITKNLGSIIPITIWLPSYALILIILVAIGNKKTNALRVKYFGIEKLKKDTHLTEYGKKFAKERVNFSENYKLYLENRKDLKKYKQDYRNYQLENLVYSNYGDYTKISKAIKWINAHRVSIAIILALIITSIILCCTLI